MMHEFQGRILMTTQTNKNGAAKALNPAGTLSYFHHTRPTNEAESRLVLAYKNGNDITTYAFTDLELSLDDNTLEMIIASDIPLFIQSFTLIDIVYFRLYTDGDETLLNAMKFQDITPSA